MAQTIDEEKRNWRPVDPTRHHREKKWDYRGRAIYHFTLPVEGRYPLFGALSGESAETAFVRLNPFGQRVCQMLGGLAQFYKDKGYALKVLAQMVMPDHVHLVIQVLEPLPHSIGAVVRGFKSGCTKVYREEFYCSGENAAEVHREARSAAPAASVPAAPAPASSVPTAPAPASSVPAAPAPASSVPAAPAEGKHSAPVQFARIFAGRGSIWQADAAYYHERILHAPGQLRRMIDYVKDNPRRLWLKSRNPDYFRMHRDTMLCGLPFTSLGNHFLLDWPDRQLVEMSRSADGATIDRRLQEVLAAAQNGAVTYTAAISSGEKLIARTVREQGFPLVVLLADGFPAEGSPHERYYKPGGVYFEACSKGSLLLLEPRERAYEHPTIVNIVEDALRRKAEAKHYAYTSLPHDSKRYYFVALNAIGQLLVGR
ncbi:transposase [Xylanibacter brevis]|uniref:transposase n=1 Tax=Xylanibacter brevis TaxID=83231 RepID=UPI0012DD06C9|nr:transposase [Xylanibacter brevis]